MLFLHRNRTIFRVFTLFINFAGNVSPVVVIAGIEPAQLALQTSALPFKLNHQIEHLHFGQAAIVCRAVDNDIPVWIKITASE